MYNEGTLHGMWLILPCTDEELKSAFDEIGINEEYEEYFITDYENSLGLKIGEYESLSILNEVATCIKSLNEQDLQTLAAVIEAEHMNTSDIIDLVDNLGKYTLNTNIKTYHDLGHYYIHDSGDFNVYTIETLSLYLDYKSCGYDYARNSDGALTSFGWLECCM